MVAKIDPKSLTSLEDCYELSSRQISAVIAVAMTHMLKYELKIQWVKDASYDPKSHRKYFSHYEVKEMQIFGQLSENDKEILNRHNLKFKITKGVIRLQSMIPMNTLFGLFSYKIKVLIRKITHLVIK